MNKQFIKKVLRVALEATLIFVAVFGTLVTFEYWKQKNEIRRELENIALYKGDERFGLVRVLGEEDQAREEYVGNKYVVQDITIGGEAVMELSQDDKSLGIIISHFQGRLYVSDDDETLNYYASWQSNKPILSKLQYRKEGDAQFVELSEESHTYLHSFTLPDIDFSSVYQYKIISRDRWGSEIESDEFVFYTGPEEASFFELLEDSFEEVFGWTVGR